ncbi:hypothetical protein [Mycetocola zhadangensis]|uniref:hypothetical protein n=1 Tax=Mycetocola zhadangensis TaxID=1164595 RepID=UPI0016000315|nr:hypothetical protein [Mycetocola zhadangensis]
MADNVTGPMDFEPPVRLRGWWPRNGVLVGGIVLVVLGVIVALTAPGSGELGAR